MLPAEAIREEGGEGGCVLAQELPPLPGQLLQGQGQELGEAPEMGCGRMSCPLTS